MTKIAAVDVTLPPIPKGVWSPLGEVPVIRVGRKELAKASKPDHAGGIWGLWLPEPRAILIAKRLTPLVAWTTLHHEMVHMWLWDAGVKFPTDEAEESVCDAAATAMTAQMIHAIATG